MTDAPNSAVENLRDFNARIGMAHSDDISDADLRRYVDGHIGMFSSMRGAILKRLAAMPAASEGELATEYAALVTFGGEIGTAHIPPAMSARILAALRAPSDQEKLVGELIEALERARPIVEADHEAAKEQGDADWEGMSFEALHGIDNAITRARNLGAPS